MGASSWFPPGLPIAITFLVAWTTGSPSAHSLSPLIRCTFLALGTDRKTFDSAGHSTEIPFGASSKRKRVNDVRRDPLACAASLYSRGSIKCGIVQLNFVR
jgi:hypothetical protein